MSPKGVEGGGSELSGHAPKKSSFFIDNLPSKKTCILSGLTLKMSRFLTDTLAKMSKIFLHILLFQNILSIFLEKYIVFLATGGGRRAPLV